MRIHTSAAATAHYHDNTLSSVQPTPTRNGAVTTPASSSSHTVAPAAAPTSGVNSISTSSSSSTMSTGGNASSSRSHNATNVGSAVGSGGSGGHLNDEELGGVKGDDYVLYYRHLGVDFVMSGASHRIIKMILHTNIPGSALFNQLVIINHFTQHSYSSPHIMHIIAYIMI
jgi:hypothetical protein